MPRPDGPGRTRPVRVSAASSGSLAERADGAGAVDDAGDGQLGAVGEGDVDAVVGSRVADTTVPVWRIQRPDVVDVGETAGGDRRHPVAAHVPGAGVVGEEGTPVVVAQPPPELGGDGTQPVDGRAPVAGLGDGALDVGVARRARSSSRVCIRVMPGGGGTGGVVGSTVRPGTSVVPRRPCAGCGRAGRRRSRRRPWSGRCRRGAGRRRAARRSTGRASRPDAASPSGAQSVPAGRRWRARRRGRRSWPVGRPVVEAHHEPVAAAVDADARTGLASHEPGVGGVLGRGAQQALDVVAVDAAGDEVLRLGLRVVVLADPAEEVLGVARERAHPARRHVEQVPVVGGGVRRAATGARGTGRPARPGSARTGPVTRCEAVSAPPAPAPITTTQQSPSPPCIQPTP